MNIWIMCPSCGFNAVIPLEDIKKWKYCPDCRGSLVVDISQGHIMQNDFHYIPKKKLVKENQTLNKKSYIEFAEIEQINKSIPIISRKEILEFVIDLNIKTPTELFNINKY